MYDNIILNICIFLRVISFNLIRLARIPLHITLHLWAFYFIKSALFCYATAVIQFKEQPNLVIRKQNITIGISLYSLIAKKENFQYDT